MNNCYHTINDIPCPHRHSKLKGASAEVVNQQSKQLLVFKQEELNLVSKTLEICRYFIGKNQNQYQNPKDILNEINQSLQILKPRNSNSLKGASSNKNKNSNETKIQSLQNIQNILKLFNLT